MQTVEMAAGAILVAIIVGLVAAMWVASRLPGARFIYVLLTAVRAIPDLTLAIFCVILVGIGPPAGMLALGIFYSAAIGKVYADLLLSADLKPIEGLRGVGAGKLTTMLFGYLPLRMKDLFMRKRLSRLHTAGSAALP